MTLIVHINRAFDILCNTHLHGSRHTVYIVTDNCLSCTLLIHYIIHNHTVVLLLIILILNVISSSLSTNTSMPRKFGDILIVRL